MKRISAAGILSLVFLVENVAGNVPVSRLLLNVTTTAPYTEETSHDHDHDGSDDDDCQGSSSEVWGAAMGSTILISLLSITGIFMIVKDRPKLMRFFIAFAVGTLLGDTMIHILPQVLGAHNHDDDDDHGDEHDSHEGLDHADHDDEEEDPYEASKYMSVTLAAMLVFFITEKIVLWHSICHAISHTRHSHAAAGSKDATFTDNVSLNEKGQSLVASDGVDMGGGGRVRGVRTVAYLNLTADLLHNFVDGVAIGATFADNMMTGLATSIAIFCHELPQELGDFAILVDAGLTRTQAVVANLFTSLVAVIGTCVGVAIGTSSENANRWMLAFTAGSFLYIALVDMLPELNRLQQSTGHSGHGHTHGSAHIFSASGSPPTPHAFSSACLIELAGVVGGMGIMVAVLVLEEELGLKC